MKIQKDKLSFQKVDDHVHLIYHDMNVIRFWTPPLLVPYGVDENFGKYYIRCQTNESLPQHINLKKIIEKMESILKKKLKIEDSELKPIYRRKIGNDDLIDIRLKQIKSRLHVDCEYENKRDSYLKTVLQIDPGSYVRIYLEIHGYWDHRNMDSEEKKENSVGLIVNACKIKVLNQTRNNEQDFIVV